MIFVRRCHLAKTHICHDLKPAGRCPISTPHSLKKKCRPPQAVKATAVVSAVPLRKLQPPSVSVCLYLSVCICVSVCLSVCLPACLSVCLSLSLSVCIGLSVCLSLSLSVCVSAGLTESLSPSLAFFPSSSFALCLSLPVSL